MHSRLGLSLSGGVRLGPWAMIQPGAYPLAPARPRRVNPAPKLRDLVMVPRQDRHPFGPRGCLLCPLGQRRGTSNLEQFLFQSGRGLETS